MKGRLLAASILAGGALSLGATPTFGSQHRAAGRTSIALTGTIHGTETRLLGIPDTGAPYKWDGHGTVKPLGATSATGTNHGVGFIGSGRARGEMTLSNSSGSVTLKITYDETPGFAPLPHHGIYTIKSGTGIYAHASGSGSLTRVAGPCPSATSGGLPGSCGTDTSFPVTYTLTARTGKHHHR